MPRTPDDWATLPLEFRLPRVQAHLREASAVDLKAVARTALELIEAGQTSESRQLLHGLDAARERTEATDKPAELEVLARELAALPERFPADLRAAFARAVRTSELELARQRLRRFRWLHFMEGPALLATMRRYAPRATELLLPPDPPGVPRSAKVGAGAGVLLIIAVKVVMALSRAAQQEDEPHGPVWRAPDEEATLETCRQASTFLRERAKYLRVAEVQQAATVLEQHLSGAPHDCRQWVTDIAEVQTAAYAVRNREDLSSMLGALAYLRTSGAALCPEARR